MHSIPYFSTLFSSFACTIRILCRLEQQIANIKEVMRDIQQSIDWAEAVLKEVKADQKRAEKITDTWPQNPNCRLQ